MLLQEYYNKLFKYSKGILYAKVPCGNRRSANTIIGDIYINNGKSYRRANVDKKPKQIHNIIWIMHYGSIPKQMLVIHIDKDTLNNKIENLELVPYRCAFTRNKLRQDNISGIPGVSFYGRDNKWRATVSYNGKVINCGCFNTIEEAKTARECAMKKYDYFSGE
jgi:hypothetical protein